MDNNKKTEKKPITCVQSIMVIDMGYMKISWPLNEKQNLIHLIRKESMSVFLTILIQLQFEIWLFVHTQKKIQSTCVCHLCVTFIEFHCDHHHHYHHQNGFGHFIHFLSFSLCLFGFSIQFHLIWFSWWQDLENHLFDWFFFIQKTTCNWPKKKFLFWIEFFFVWKDFVDADWCVCVCARLFNFQSYLNDDDDDLWFFFCRLAESYIVWDRKNILPEQQKKNS